MVEQIRLESKKSIFPSYNPSQLIKKSVEKWFYYGNTIIKMLNIDIFQMVIWFIITNINNSIILFEIILNYFKLF